LQAASHAACWKYKSLLPSCLSAQRTWPAGACGKVEWRRVRTGRGAMCRKDDLRVTRCADGPRTPALHRGPRRQVFVVGAAPKGGEPERLSSHASDSLWQSEGREFVASQLAIPSLSLGRSLVAVAREFSPQVRNQGPRRLFVTGVENQAHANQKIDMSGAVMPEPKATIPCRPVGMPLANAPPVRDSVRPMQPGNQRRRISPRSAAIAGFVRLTRLCVLIKPNPVRRLVHWTSSDFASSSTLCIGPAGLLRRSSFWSGSAVSSMQHRFR